MKKITAAILLLVSTNQCFSQETPAIAPIQHYKRIAIHGTPIPATSASAGPRAASPTFIANFDSSINSHPRAADIKATINSALQLYKDKLTDPVTVSITFKNISSGLGQSSTVNFVYAYGDYRNALVAHSTSPDDAAAVASIPATPNNPVNNDPMVNMSAPLARVLGLDGAVQGDDSTVSLNMSDMNITAADTDKSKYSLFATVLHEVDEVLGLGSNLDGSKNAVPPISGPVNPEDLFRYEKTGGVRSYTNSKSAESFFSIDGGKTILGQFNQDKSGDFADWYSPGGQTPQVQDAFGTPGSTETLGLELRVLDVIGWTLASTGTGGTVGGGTPAGNHPPTIDSAATYNPNPAGVGIVTTLFVGASDPDKDTLTYAWDFGDNTKGSGPSVTHTYSSEGSYKAVVTVSDGKGGVATSNVTVNVIVPVIKAGVIKPKFLLNFKTGSDSIDVTLSAADFGNLTDNDVVDVVIGDPGTDPFDSGTLFKNKAFGSIGKLSLNVRSGTLRYVATKTSLQDLLLPYGAVNDDVSTTVTVPFYFLIKGSYYGDQIDFFYSAKADKSGSGK